MARKWVVLAGLAFVVLGVGAFVYLGSIPRVSAARLRERIAADLPVGTPRKQVEAWLTAHRMTWNDILDGDRRRVGLQVEFEDVYPLEFFSNTDVHLNIDFDEQDNLASFTVEEVIFGF